MLIPGCAVTGIALGSAVSAMIAATTATVPTHISCALRAALAPQEEYLLMPGVKSCRSALPANTVTNLISEQVTGRERKDEQCHCAFNRCYGMARRIGSDWQSLRGISDRNDHAPREGGKQTWQMARPYWLVCRRSSSQFSSAGNVSRLAWDVARARPMELSCSRHCRRDWYAPGALRSRRRGHKDSYPATTNLPGLVANPGTGSRNVLVGDGFRVGLLNDPYRFSVLDGCSGRFRAGFATHRGGHPERIWASTGPQSLHRCPELQGCKWQDLCFYPRLAAFPTHQGNPCRNTLALECPAARCFAPWEVSLSCVKVGSRSFFHSPCCFWLVVGRTHRLPQHHPV